MTTTNDQKIISLDGMAGGCWTSGGSFRKEGTLEELKQYFSEGMTTGYSFDGHEIVPAEYFWKVGEHILATIEYDDLIKITKTLEDRNDHFISTGRTPWEKRDREYHFYQSIESEEFKEAKPEDRINLYEKVDAGQFDYKADAIKIAGNWIIASTFMPDSFLFLYDKKFDFADKYPNLMDEIKEIWKVEACEKSIFPYLEKLAQE